MTRPRRHSVTNDFTIEDPLPRQWHAAASALRRAAIFAGLAAAVAGPAQAATSSGPQSAAQACASPYAIVGTAGDDTLVGTAGADVICGLGGNDVLIGGYGDDVLDGGHGADLMTGGAGVDTVEYSWRTAGVAVEMLYDDANDGEVGENDRVQPDVENVIGSAHDDSIVGNDAANVFEGNGGSDALTGYKGDDRLLGGAGNDTLRGAAGNDHLFGGDGDDTLFPGGYSGTDVLEGGAGTDTADYSYFDSLRISLDGIANDGEPGENDNVKADVENVQGGFGDDLITGNAQANVLVGNGGNDVITGLLGEDVLSGGDGDDHLNAAHARALDEDAITCGTGYDTARIDEGDTVAGDCESVLLVPTFPTGPPCRPGQAPSCNQPLGSAAAPYAKPMASTSRGFDRQETP